MKTFSLFTAVGLILCAVLLGFRTTLAQQGAVVFSEIMYDLPGADDPNEWVEIVNNSGGSIDLAAWRFNDGANHLFAAPPEKGGQGSLTLAPWTVAILADDAAAFLASRPGFTATVIDTVMSLQNTSDTISLVDEEGNIVDSVTYTNGLGAAGDGKSLERIEGIWQASATQGGTPGAVTSTPPPAPPPPTSPTPPPPLYPEPACTEPAECVEGPPPPAPNTPPLAVITPAQTSVFAGVEILFDGSDSSDADGDTLSFRWDLGDGTQKTNAVIAHSYQYAEDYTVRLTVNDGKATHETTVQIRVEQPHYAQSVKINELLPDPFGADAEGEFIELINEGEEEAALDRWQLDDAADGSAAWMFPAGTIMKAGEILMFARRQTSLALNNSGDSVRLFAPDGKIMDVAQYDQAPEGSSFARVESVWQWTLTPTPGSANILTKKEEPEPEQTPFAPPAPAKNEEDDENASAPPAQTPPASPQSSGKDHGGDIKAPRTQDQQLQNTEQALAIEQQKAAAKGSLFPVAAAMTLLALLGGFGVAMLRRALNRSEE